MSTPTTISDRTHPRPVHHTPASSVSDTTTGQTTGMIRQSAIVKLSPSIVGTLMRAQPNSSSAVHHHGEQDTIVYAVSGNSGFIVWEDDKSGEKVKTAVKPGDWALIPAWREHQEVNEGEEEVVWVIVRAPGGEPVVENLGGWGESRVLS